MASTIVLERDGHDQPWGFRLQGGVDVGIPLSVQRVLVGTPAEGVLLKGDVITKISQTEAKNLTHQQAADLFNNAGNQISVSIKRSGQSGGAAPVVNGTSSYVGVPPSPPVSGGVALPGLVSLSTARSSDNPAVASLPQTQFMLKSDLPTPIKEPTANLETLSIQNQPYRTTPLITPGAKIKSEIGTGSMQHLKMQEDHITGVKEPQYVPVPQSVVRNQKANEILMKQKTQQTLMSTTQQQQQQQSVTQQVTQQVVTQQTLTSSSVVSSSISSSSSSSSSNVAVAPAPAPAVVAPAVVAPPKPVAVVAAPSHSVTAPKQFNSPAGLYSAENALQQQSSGGLNPVSSGSSLLAAEAVPGVKGTRVNKPHKHMMPRGLPRMYDPEKSATWLAIHEEENCQLVTEHGPTESKVYSI